MSFIYNSKFCETPSQKNRPAETCPGTIYRNKSVTMPAERWQYISYSLPKTQKNELKTIMSSYSSLVYNFHQEFFKPV